MTHRAPAHRPGPPPAPPGRPGRRPGSRFARVLVVTIAAVAGLLFVLAGVALAYWATTDSSNPAEAVAATLTAPTAGMQNGTATGSTVQITWTAPAGYTPTGYTVLRCTGSSCTNFTAISNGTCSGTISGTSCTDTDTGLATGTTYTYEVQADLDNWVSAPGSSFTAATGAAFTSLAFTGQPTSGQNIQAAGTGSFPVQVAIENANGTVATNDSTDTVTLAIASGDNPGSGTLSCTGGLTATVSSGAASFTGCAITQAGNGYQLTASSTTDPSLTAPANATSFNITAGTFAQYGVGLAATATAGKAVTGVTLTAEDSDGNTVTSYNPASPVTITWSGPAKSPDGTAPTLPSGMVSFTSGVSTTSLSVTFTDAGRQTLTATDTSPRTGSATTTVSGAAPASLVLANCVVDTYSQTCNGDYVLGYKTLGMMADVRALDKYGNAASITGKITMSVTSGNTSDFTIGGATLTIDGTAKPPNQSTTTFSVRQVANPASNTTITIQVTSGPSIPNLTFTVQN
jgi:hypothetical protein